MENPQVNHQTTQNTHFELNQNSSDQSVEKAKPNEQSSISDAPEKLGTQILSQRDHKVEYNTYGISQVPFLNTHEGQQSGIESGQTINDSVQDPQQSSQILSNRSFTSQLSSRQDQPEQVSINNLVTRTSNQLFEQSQEQGQNNQTYSFFNNPNGQVSYPISFNIPRQDVLQQAFIGYPHQNIPVMQSLPSGLQSPIHNLQNERHLLLAQMQQLQQSQTRSQMLQQLFQQQQQNLANQNKQIETQSAELSKEAMQKTNQSEQDLLKNLMLEIQKEQLKQQLILQYIQQQVVDLLQHDQPINQMSPSDYFNQQSPLYNNQLCPKQQSTQVDSFMPLQVRRNSQKMNEQPDDQVKNQSKKEFEINKNIFQIKNLQENQYTQVTQLQQEFEEKVLITEDPQEQNHTGFSNTNPQNLDNASFNLRKSDYSQSNDDDSNEQSFTNIQDKLEKKISPKNQDEVKKFLDSIHNMINSKSQQKENHRHSRKKSQLNESQIDIKSDNEYDDNLEITLDIFERHIFECSIDQKCSRFIQDRLRSSKNDEEIERFIQKLIEDSTIDLEQLMMDQNANYVIQLVLQKQSQYTEVCHELIFKIILNNVYKLSIHRNGCRVMQTAFDVFNSQRQIQLIEKLLYEDKIKDCSFDFNGNHVIQKLLVNLKSLEMTELYQHFIMDLERDLLEYCQHEYCCRIVQRLVENCSHDLIINLIDKILNSYHLLIENQYGTFVLCSILQSGNFNQKIFLIRKVRQNMHRMSLDRDGSKLLENSLKMIGDQRFDKLQYYLMDILIRFVTTPLEEKYEGFENRQQNDGKVAFNDILVSKYGNYVMQTAIDCVRSHPQLTQDFQYSILRKIKLTCQQLGKYKCEQLPIKHVLKHLQKLKIDLNQLQPYENNHKAAQNSKFTRSINKSSHTFQNYGYDSFASPQNQDRYYQYEGHDRRMYEGYQYQQQHSYKNTYSKQNHQSFTHRNSIMIGSQLQPFTQNQAEMPIYDFKNTKKQKSAGNSIEKDRFTQHSSNWQRANNTQRYQKNKTLKQRGKS